MMNKKDRVEVGAQHAALPPSHLWKPPGLNEPMPQGNDCSDMQSLNDEADTNRAYPAHVLVVEDSMIIALDAEEALLDLGVPKVTLASSVKSALEAIRESRPDAALLDFNLGYESSEPIAEALDRVDVPYWFVTGYGDAVAQLSQSHARGVLQKPYLPADFVSLLAQLRGHS